MNDPLPTRQRLVDAAMHLFASQGFDSTSVGDIESAAGLEPRRGGLYKHFASKQSLLDAAVRTSLDEARSAAKKVAKLETPNLRDANSATLRPLVVDVGRWFLDEMDRLEDLTRVFEHDAHRLTHMVDEVRTELVNLSYRSAVGLIRNIRPDVHDAEALAVIMLGPLVTLRRTKWTYGASPLDIDDDRFLSVWADATLATLKVS